MNTGKIDWRYGLKTYGIFPASYSLILHQIDKYNIQYLSFCVLKLRWLKVDPLMTSVEAPPNSPPKFCRLHLKAT